MLINCTLIVLTFFIAHYSFEQSNTVSSGGNATGASGSVSYTIGQIDYISSNSASGNTNQGVQQPYEISISNGLNDVANEISLSIGPNPAIDNLTLTFKSDETDIYRFELFDQNAKELLVKTNLKKVETIDMSPYSVGTYQLKISGTNRSQKTFKIIKN